MHRKLTITVDEDVYKGLYAKIGRRKISSFLNQLARPLVVSEDIEAGYRAMAADQEHEAEATEWIEGIVGDMVNEEG
jgi:predicted CopG family antitoxin